MVLTLQSQQLKTTLKQLYQCHPFCYFIFEILSETTSILVPSFKNVISALDYSSVFWSIFVTH